MQYMTKLAAQLEDTKSMRVFFEYLKERDLSQFDPRVYPSSSLRDAMIAGQEQPEMGFLKDWLSNGHDSQGRKLHVPSNHTGFSMLQAKYST